MKIYAFIYNFDIFESSPETISLHKTKKGAFKAMNKFINNVFQEIRNNSLTYGKRGDEDHIYSQDYCGIKTFELND